MQGKAIFGNDRKNDRVDARSLAQFARVDRKLLFPECTAVTMRKRLRQYSALEMRPFVRGHD